MLDFFCGNEDKRFQPHVSHFYAEVSISFSEKTAPTARWTSKVSGE
jgi:hypothetical protein